MLPPAQLEKQVRRELPRPWAAVSQRPNVIAACTGLSLAEKALVWYYTDRGFRSLNRLLHGGGHSWKTTHLALALYQLPICPRDVVSAVYLDAQQLALYQVGQAVTWPAFLSTTTSHAQAERFLRRGPSGQKKNCLLLIRHLTGRSIAPLSCYGPNGPKPDQQEVLFAPGRSFEVLARTNSGTETGAIEIELKELP